ncbi:MAG: hypothetical protein L3J75_12255 [Methylococcaceae bacterium]|nr:hypothetical protein [Methylococcaceae bacterium]
MIIKNLFKASILLLLLICKAQATTIAVTSNDGTILFGFDNIAVGTKTFDVRFVDGTFFDIFSDGTPTNVSIPFVSLSRDSAALALKLAFNEHPVYDNDPTKINGISSNIFADIITPFSYDSALVSVLATRYRDGIDTLGFNDDFDLNHIRDPFINTFDVSNETYALWSVAVTSTVPVPTAFWLMSSGLLWIGAVTKKNQRKK